jgi:hypothetical protein
MSRLHEWGKQVWVHTLHGTKLDGCSRIGRWIGYDEISNGHRIYWPDKCSVTVKRSIKFANDNVILLSNPIAKPIQGESKSVNKNPDNLRCDSETKPESRNQEHTKNYEDDPDDSSIDQTEKENQTQDEKQRVSQIADEPEITNT